MTPSPYELYKQTGGGDAYRVEMLEHGHIQPIAPWDLHLLKHTGKRVSTCGLTHDPDWSEWRRIEDAGRWFEGRWCRVCARTNVRELADGQQGEVP